MIILTPLAGIVYIKTEKVQMGALDGSSRDSAVEYAEVLAVGEGVTSLKPGDKIFVKSWGCDNIDYKGERHTFVNLETKAILAILP